jgi:hypothetical protein
MCLLEQFSKMAAVTRSTATTVLEGNGASVLASGASYCSRRSALGLSSSSKSASKWLKSATQWWKSPCVRTPSECPERTGALYVALGGATARPAAPFRSSR